ncbi:hypothetical protein PIB30_055188 [Stylosanthes scabra]|uniref:Transposase-associated domain-containing protein n=1 Tax=Stylosanthes scabra TaxID=79078 RepID=A0ABU6YGF6_9FABA|nr:hypothetical protein [Stylosanthes scabra]
MHTHQMCPCAKCKCKKYKTQDEVRCDLLWTEFMPNYWVWDRHGEASLEVGNSSGLGGYWHGDDEQGGETWEENAARYQSMVVDAFPHQYAWLDDQPAEDSEE